LKLLPIAAHGYTATTGATAPVFRQNILQLHCNIQFLAIDKFKQSATKPTIAPTSASESPTSASRSD